MRRLAVLSVLLLSIFAFHAQAQEPKGGETKRGAYFVKYGPAKPLAETLAKHFKDVAQIQAGPDGTASCILINSSPAVFGEVLALLDKMDRKPSSVAIEVFLITLNTDRVDGNIKTLEAKDFEGTIEETAKRLEAMQSKGEIAELKRIQMTELEGQRASCSISAQVPYTSSIVKMPRGLTQSSTERVMIGSNVRVTPRVNADKSITLDAVVSYSDMRTSDKLRPIGTDEKGTPIPASVFPTGQAEARVIVPSGKMVLLKNSTVSRDPGAGATQIAIGARVLDTVTK
ncbi:hypothetical protein BH10PLA2_BH10PLA2_08450 [soil metagenome]